MYAIEQTGGSGVVDCGMGVMSGNRDGRSFMVLWKSVRLCWCGGRWSSVGEVTNCKA